MSRIASLDLVRSAVSAVSSSLAREQAAVPGAAHGVVTLSRQAGTRAPEIAALVCERLNEKHPADQPWLVYDRNLVQKVAEENELSDRLIERLDERDEGFVEGLLSTFTGRPVSAVVGMKMARTIRGIAKVGRAVVIGRGAQTILRSMPNVLHVRLIAPLEYRVATVMKEQGLDEDAARRHCLEEDEKRADYVRHVYGKDPEDTQLYDLTVNVARVQPDHTADVIVRAVEEMHLDA